MIGDGGEGRGRRPGVGGIVGGGMRYDGCGTRSGEGGTRYERNGYEETSKDVIFLAGGGSRDWDEGRRAGAGRRRRSENFSLREAWRKVDDGEKFSLWGRGREWTTVKNFHGNNGRVWKVLDETRCGRWKVLDGTRCGRWKVLDGTERVGGRRGDGCSKKNG